MMEAEVAQLQQRIEVLAEEETILDIAEAREAVGRLLDLLEAGSVRAASPVGGEWEVHPWVK